jgi:hypothetical protein
VEYLLGALLAIQLGAVPTAHAAELDVSALKTIATAEAVSHGLNVEHFLNVIECESKFAANQKGDYRNGVPTSYGITQIHLPAHPEITKAQALDPFFSLHWAAEQWQDGNAKAWTCWRTLYGS